jgi:hypothetical protein
MVTADVWAEGRHYRQWANWAGALGTVEELEPVEQQGTRLTFQLDDEYLPGTATTRS